MNLLKNCGAYLDWISLHSYWDMVPEHNELADYEQCMAFTSEIDRSVQDVRGILTALHLEKKIKIVFDEWNLRSWHHPNVHTVEQGRDKKDYIHPRNKNDDNSSYTMADAIFTACFLNAMNRNCDIVGMANFAPVLNTRGCIYSYKDGIVLRSTYHVFDLYVNYLGDTVIDLWAENEIPMITVKHKYANMVSVEQVDILATKWQNKTGMAVAAVNKHQTDSQVLKIYTGTEKAVFDVVMYSICGNAEDSYNDIDRNEVFIIKSEVGKCNAELTVELKPHSVNIIQLLNN